MVAYAFLFLFVTAAVLLIVRSHYRWTYFFASALFVFLAGGMLMLTAQWQRALNFASVWFVVLILFHRLKIHYYKQPLLISDFLLIADWRNWETLFHYKEAVIGMAGLLALAAYAVSAGAVRILWVCRGVGRARFCLRRRSCRCGIFPSTPAR